MILYNAFNVLKPQRTTEPIQTQSNKQKSVTFNLYQKQLLIQAKYHVSGQTPLCTQPQLLAYHPQRLNAVCSAYLTGMFGKLSQPLKSSYLATSKSVGSLQSVHWPSDAHFAQKWQELQNHQFQSDRDAISDF